MTTLKLKVLPSLGRTGATGPAGAGNVVGPSASVFGEIAIYGNTSGTSIDRAANTGVLKATSGVLGTAAAGTDYLAPAAIGVTVQAFDAQLFSNVPQNSQSGNYTAVATDAQKHILHPAADNNARTFTIPANSSVAYPIGTRIMFINEINTVTIAITSDTLTLSPGGTTGSRTLAANGMATAIKITSTKWMISGFGLT